MGALEIIQIYFKRAQNSDFFYVKGREKMGGAKGDWWPDFWIHEQWSKGKQEEASQSPWSWSFDPC